MDECVVLDNGSSGIKAGYSGEDNPTAIIPSLVGLQVRSQRAASPFGRRPLVDHADDSHAGMEDTTTLLVGKRARANASQLELSSPITRGFIDDWDGMQAIWGHAFEDVLNVNTESTPVLLSDTPLNPKESREKMAQIMFEHFQVPGFYIAPESVLSLFATGRTRGIVLGVGAGVSSAVPIFEGFALPHATKRLEIAGDDLTDLLQARLPSRLSREVVQDIKETTCSVLAPSATQRAAGTLVMGRKERFPPLRRTSSSLCATAESVDSRLEESKAGLPSPVHYELPDGQIVDVSVDCQHDVPNALFEPSLLGDSGKSLPGISQLTFQSILACDKTLQADLFSSIVLAGGSSMFPGLATRLETELSALSTTSKVQIVQDSQRKAAAWIGGSMFGSLSTFPEILISRAEW
eukprot:CAMPEP_0202052620 /NCGR_PEP_ID=MMETSP0963-20130614/5374_1 /ASSEMBLY_ACC=CAM_ASM_000494 /TAXON_ID=4773 /ORGANISM="Schizochytrium aggregatum, Strain ATCC28209" /LENGTH=407 /DNA_ID=CAMNT_0048617911 /DNA_START=20 /DNA_END=1240 /DNA_ORIENTATION=-